MRGCGGGDGIWSVGAAVAGAERWCRVHGHGADGAQDPVAIDAIWQKASAKYDSARQGLLADVARADGEGPYRADWESLQKYEVPEWYADAKFGIFIHWGVYSVPAFGSEWYPRDMYQRGRRNLSITSRRTGRRTSLDIRISFRSLRRRSLIRLRGRRCLKRRGRSMSCRWRSITMGLRCMTAG